MVILLLIFGLTAILLCLALFYFFRESRESVQKMEHRSVVRHDHQTGDPALPNNLRPSDAGGNDTDGPADQSAMCPFETSALFQASLNRGINRVFSDGMPTSDRPLFRIGEVDNVVRQQVQHQIRSLKNFDTVHKLQRIIGDHKSTMTELSRIITRNPILSAKILQVANSSYYGMQQKLNSISHAIMIIGMANLKAIIYHEGVLSALGEKNFRDNPAMQSLWQHVNYTSIFASYIHYLFGGLNMGNLFTLGLLHDIGKFIMMKMEPIAGKDAVPDRIYSADWTPAEEENIYGINHALIGRLALQYWGLSPLMVDAVTLHHAPAYLAPSELRLNQEALQYLLVLFLADQAARLFSGTGDDDVRIDRLLPAYHYLIDQSKLSRLIMDKSLLTQLREAEAITGVYA